MKKQKTHLAEDVKFPVLLRHHHITLDKMEGLDWMRLHNLWCKENMSLMKIDESQSDEEKSDEETSEKLCKFMNYCDLHNIWVNPSSEEQCQKGKAANEKCRINVYLFCSITDQSIFRVFDWRHGFRPSMFG